MFQQLLEGAVQLGVIPVLALLLIFALYRQNRDLLRDRREMEHRLLEIVSQIQSDYRELLLRTYLGNSGESDARDGADDPRSPSS
jgi:hypothetical protein